MTQPDTNSGYRLIETIEKGTTIVLFDNGGYSIMKNGNFLLTNRTKRRRSWGSKLAARDAYLKERLCWITDCQKL